MERGIRLLLSIGALFLLEQNHRDFNTIVIFKNTLKYPSGDVYLHVVIHLVYKFFLIAHFLKES